MSLLKCLLSFKLARTHKCFFDAQSQLRVPNICSNFFQYTQTVTFKGRLCVCVHTYLQCMCMCARVTVCKLVCCPLPCRRAKLQPFGKGLSELVASIQDREVGAPIIEHACGQRRLLALSGMAVRLLCTH